MAGKAIWKGQLHFGLIDMPVKLHTAVKEEHIQFHLLHKKDHVKLKQQMICAHEKMPAPPEEQVRGFKQDDGRYVLVTPSELEETLPEESRIINVLEFVKASQINPLYITRGYYLEPDNASKAYLTLAAAPGNGFGRHLYVDNAQAVLYRSSSFEREDSPAQYTPICR